MQGFLAFLRIPKSVQGAEWNVELCTLSPADNYYRHTLKHFQRMLVPLVIGVNSEPICIALVKPYVSFQ
jgi:hypothetical protein